MPFVVATLALGCSNPSADVVDVCDVAPGEVRARVSVPTADVSPNELEVTAHGAVYCTEAQLCCNPAMFARTSLRVTCAEGSDVVLEGMLGTCEGNIDGAPLAGGDPPPIDERCTIPCPALEGEVVGTVVDDGGQRVLTVTSIE